MYKVEYRSQILRKHMGVTHGEMAKHFDVTKKVLLSWFRDPTKTPKEKLPELAAYFGLEESELYEEITIEVEYKFMSQLSNQIGNSIRKFEEDDDYDIEDLIADFGVAQDMLKDKLIQKQEELKLR